VTWLDGSGKPTHIVRWVEDPVPANDSNLGVWEAWYREANANPSGNVPRVPREWEAYVSERLSLAPSHLPYFVELAVDEEGTAWLGEYIPGTPGQRRFFRLTRDGRRLGDVELPRAVRVLAVSSDFLLTLESNELDVEAVALWPLH
jgi:hypothetical protein